MTAATWHFQRKPPSLTARDPISAEFFADESVEDAARAVVRESIQNSLDAHDSADRRPVEILIRVGAGADAASPGDTAPFFQGVWPHLWTKGSGLQDPPVDAARCSYLTIEDFATSGLEGDPEECSPAEGKKNSFYAFFRAEAFSEKGGDDRGRWGVGKLVFPRSSRGSAFFGFTVQRSTKTPLLMGRIILRHHRVAGVDYLPDAMFGIRKTVHGDPEFVIPCGDPSVISRFCRTFGVTRRDEPGLSVVVPWLDEEDQFNANELTKGIAAEYLLPILRGDLVVTVQSRNLNVKLDRAELMKNSQKWTDEELSVLLQLGRFAADVPGDRLFTTRPADQSNAPKWPEDAMTAEDVAILRKRLEQGEAMAFDVPLAVQLKDGAGGKSRLRVHLVSTGTSATVAPVFVREGITVTSARGTRVPGYATLVTIDDGPLATLLGDAENPAHTEWRPNTRGFKQKYRYAKAFLEFVRQAPLHLFSTVFMGDREDDRFALGAFFPDMGPLDDPSTRGGRGPKRTRGGDVVPAPKIPQKPRQFSMTKKPGGFEVRPGAPDASKPRRLQIRAAYDVRRGQPLKKYERYDFDFGSQDMVIEAEGAEVTGADGNEIHAVLKAADFRIHVTGFDENRDLFVKVTVPGEDDER